MSEHKSKFHRDNLDLAVRNTTLWVGVNTGLLTEDQLIRFKNLKLAICDYLGGEKVKDICQRREISRQRLVALVKRCVKEHPDGRLWGWRALISHARQKTPMEIVSELTTSIVARSQKKKQRAMPLFRLFYLYPQVERTVYELFLKIPNELIIHESKIPVKSIHKKFLDACREAGIKGYEYPFNTKNLGFVSLWKYLKQLFNRHQRRATLARSGKEAARMIKTQLSPQAHLPEDPETMETVVRPYQRVEFDAHYIDIFCTVTLPSIYGGTVEKVLDRIWLLAIIDVMTRCILGYHFCFTKQYSSDDVMICARNALRPWAPKPLTIPDLKYAPRSGLPSGLFKEAEWALWDELAFDNARSNLSEKVRHKLTAIINCAINAGPVETPERLIIIERFFGTLEENGFHRLPSTTGSNPSDSRRDKPEEKALELKISFKHLEELTDVLIAQYNATPHSGIGFRSPLEYMEYFLHSEDMILPRQMPPEDQEESDLLTIEVSRVVRGNPATGVSPYIDFQSVRYKNEILARSPDLIGKTLTLIVNPNDVRSIKAFLPNGADFGMLTATGRWGRTPHTLEMRKAIFYLRRKKLLSYTEQDDPIHVYLNYLGKESKTSKNARRKYAKIQHWQKDYPEPKKAEKKSAVDAKSFEEVTEQDDDDFAPPVPRTITF